MVKLLVAGGGKMGEALLGGLLGSGWATADELAVMEPDRARQAELADRFEGLAVSDGPVGADAALVAVKPHHVAEVCRSVAQQGIGRILSIAAGVTLATMEAELPTGTAVVRAMPNTPSLIGRGAAAIAGGTAAVEDDLAWAERVLGSVGTVVRVDEAQLDAVTGLSGSGPAYVFLVAEALIDAGVLNGLTRSVATELVTQTILGAGELLATRQSAGDLRAAVTSPGGTTAAGLQALEAAAMRAAFADAVTAAAARSRALG